MENILEKQRKENMETAMDVGLDPTERLPHGLHRKFEVQIVYTDLSKVNIRSISTLHSGEIGSLIALKAIVVRTADVKPKMIVATFACDVCGCENYTEVKNDSYRPMLVCASKKCQTNTLNGKLTFLPGHSTFVSAQNVKVQETPNQLKDGSIPRSLKL